MLTENKRQQLDGMVQKMVQSKEPDENIRFVVDNFKKKHEENIPLVPKFLEPTVRKVAKVGEFLGMKPLGTAIAEKITGVPQTYTPKQVVGSALQTGLLATPMGLPKTLLGKTLQFAGIGAGIGFGKGLEEGKTVIESLGEAAKSGAISGALPIVGKGISTVAKKVAKPIGEVVSSVLGQFIGKPAEVIRKAFQDSQKVALAMAQKKIPENIRTEIVKLLNGLREKSKTVFRKGLEEQQKLHLKSTGQALALVKQAFGNLKDNISSLLRQNRVAISNTGILNFDKLTSAIVSPAERKNVQLAVETILGQKKFLPKDVQAVSARLSKLSKYTEGAVSQSSAIIRQIHSIYKKGLEKAYPQLSEIRTKYALEKTMYDEIGKVIGAEKTNPLTVTSAVKRLSNLFNEDNELYLKIIKGLEDKTGMDILAELAASEFSKVAPASFGSKMAQAGLLAGGAIINPFILLALPLFSPKFIGKAATTLGKTSQFIGRTAPKIAPMVPKITSQITK